MKTYELTYQLKLEGNSSPLSVKSPADAAPYLREHCFPFKDMWREKAVVVFLDKANHITGYHVLSVGNAEQCCISPRDVVRAALIANAHSVILSHNHPSGNVRPGASDIEMTKKVKDALTVVSLTLLDHIIISADPADGVFSFAEDVVIKTN